MTRKNWRVAMSTRSSRIRSRSQQPFPPPPSGPPSQRQAAAAAVTRGFRPLSQRLSRHPARSGPLRRAAVLEVADLFEVVVPVHCGCLDQLVETAQELDRHPGRLAVTLTEPAEL